MHRSGGDREAGVGARTDAELAARAAGSDPSAFGELYRRHADAAWRLAQAVTGNADDAADAVADAFARVLQALPTGRLVDDGEHFRAYLLATTRNAAIDALRRNERLRPTDSIDDLDSPARVPGPSERMAEKADAALVAEAFRSLPERWRSVLWLTEVEGIPPRDVADRMGLTANSVAQLAVRARAGLRERWLQAHLGGRVREECRFCVEHLGAYVAGRLVPRHLARADQHLAECADCRDRLGELRDVGASLRRVVMPLPLALGPEVVARWSRSTAAAGPASAVRAGSLSPAMARAQKPLLALSTGIFALGVISATVMSSPGAPRRGEPVAPIAVRPVSPQLVADLPVAIDHPVVISLDDTARLLGAAPGDAAEPVVVAPQPEVVVPVDPTLSLLPDPLAGVVPSSPADSLLGIDLDLPVDLDLSVAIAPVPPVALSVGGDDGCTGVAVGEIAVGCATGAAPAAGDPAPPPAPVEVAVTAPVLGTLVLRTIALPSL